VPRAEETISYNIPAYQLSGRTVIFFAGLEAALRDLSRPAMACSRSSRRSSPLRGERTVDDTVRSARSKRAADFRAPARPGLAPAESWCTIMMSAITERNRQDLTALFRDVNETLCLRATATMCAASARFVLSLIAEASIRMLPN
jgi:hypothetical protein